MAETLSVLFPAAHLLIADHDSAPVSLFEAGQLFRLAQQVLLDAQRLAGAADAPSAGVILCSECRAEVNAGFVLVRQSQQFNGPCPDSDTELANLVVKAREEFQASQHPPLEPAVDGPCPLADVQAAALRRPFAATPLGNCAALHPADYLRGWAIMGEWLTLLCFSPPLSGAWPRHGHGDGLPLRLRSRAPSVINWARAAFEQGVLGCLHAFDTSRLSVVELPGDLLFQATQASPSSFAQPVMIHAHAGKQHLQALATIAAWQTLEQGLFGTKLPPAWLQGTWHVSAGLRFVFPQPLAACGRTVVSGCPAAENWSRAFAAPVLVLPLLPPGSTPGAVAAVSLRTAPIGEPKPTEQLPFDFSRTIEIHCGGLGATALADAAEGPVPHVQVLTGGGGGCYGPGEARVDDAQDPSALRCALSVSAYTHDITMLATEAKGAQCWAQVRGLVNQSRQALYLLDFPPGCPLAPPGTGGFGFLRYPAWTNMYRVLSGYEQADSVILLPGSAVHWSQLPQPLR